MLACAEPDYFGCFPAGSCDTGDSAPADPLPWTASQALTVLEQGVALGLPDTSSFRDTYLQVRAQGDEVCPGPTESFGLEEPCTSASGWQWYGVSQWLEEREDPDQVFYTLYPGSFEIVDPDGVVFLAGGELEYQADRVTLDWSARLLGTFDYPAASGWLGHGASAGLTYSGQGAPGARTLELQGPLAQGDTALFVHELVWDEQACDGHPQSVVISARDPLGVWFDYQATCSDCGEVVGPTGASLGAGCLDLRAPVAELVDRMQVPQ